MVAVNTVPSQAQSLMHWELADPVGGIPGYNAVWLELYPVFGTPHLQKRFRDNGDGEVSVGDVINVDSPETAWKVIWVGPTYHLRPVAGGELSYYEPQGGYGGTPIGEYWIQIYPTYASFRSVDGWDDIDLSGDATVGDDIHFLQDAPDVWHTIEEVGFNVAVEPTEVPIDATTWGQIKVLFGN
jgi:hypothetical protein